MRERVPNEQAAGSESWEEAVARYLAEHPEFFQRHPEALAHLKLAHETGGRAVSLIERQVQVLRSREQDLQRQLRELIAIARENDVLGTRLHRLALALIEVPTRDEALEATIEILRADFRLDAVVVGRGAAPPRAGGRPAWGWRGGRAPPRRSRVAARSTFWPTIAG
jgi:hypothetical protein